MLDLVLILDAKFDDGYRGTWTGCFKKWMHATRVSN